MTAILLNQAGRVHAFNGGEPKHNGFRLIPGVRLALNDEQVKAVKESAMQARVMRALIDDGSILDVNDTFADLPAIGPVKVPALPKPETTRFDSQTAPAAVAKAARDPHEFVPPAPTLPKASVEVVDDSHEDPHEDPPVAEVVPPQPLTVRSKISDMPEALALLAISQASAVEDLGRMWQEENDSPSKRTGVMQAIEARGNALVAKK